MWLSWLLVWLQPASGVSPPPQVQEPSLSLAQAVNQALEVAPRRAMALASISRAESEVRAAKSQGLPQFGFDGVAVRFDEPMLVAPLHGLDFTRAPDFERTLLQAEFGLGYVLFDGGARRGEVDRAQALARVAGAQLTSAEQLIVASTVEAYVTVISSRDAEASQGERLRALRSEADRVDRFLREGQAARVEQLRVSAALASARADSTGAGSARRAAEARLARLTGLDLVEIARGGLHPVALRADGAMVSRSPLTDALFETAPALREATARVTAAQSATRAARAAWLPSVRLEGRTITYGSAGGSDVPVTTEWGAGFRIKYPLFTGGRRSADIDRREALTREAEAARHETVLALAERVEQLLVEIEETKARGAALEVAITQLREVARTEALSLAEGVGLQSDYLSAEADLAGTRAEWSRTRAREVSAHVRLAQLLGRLSPEAVNNLLEVGS